MVIRENSPDKEDNIEDVYTSLRNQIQTPIAIDGQVVTPFHQQIRIPKIEINDTTIPTTLTSTQPSAAGSTPVGGETPRQRPKTGRVEN